jgi:hypothetical protein
MKKNIAFLLLASLLTFTIISSCKKDNDDVKPQLDTQTKQFNEDANDYKSESDQADDEVNNSLDDISGFGRSGNSLSSPLCGATIDTSQVAQKIVFFNFDGVTPCFSPSRTRSGQIKVELIAGALWSDAGSVLKMTFTNYKVTRLSDNKSITFNGIKTLKNINGNNWLGFLAGTATLKYQSRAFNVAVTFTDGTTATWNTAHTTQWSYNATNGIIFTANGDTTINGVANTEAWGVNRYGASFQRYYNTPILSNTYCGLWRPNAGELVHHVNNSHFTLTMGVDQNGNPTPYACAYGFKVNWTDSNGNSQSVILSY